jgi:hypothetical protein
MAVAGQIDRHSRSPERQHHPVPGVRVQPSAVQEYQLGFAAAPDDRTDVAVARPHPLPPDRGSAFEMDSQLACLLAQQGEFVAVEQVGCHVPSAG